MYVEFTLCKPWSSSWRRNVNAFNVLGVPKKVMVDNLRCAVLRHPRGEHAEFNPRYLDFRPPLRFPDRRLRGGQGQREGVRFILSPVGHVQRPFRWATSAAGRSWARQPYRVRGITYKQWLGPP
ncbi:MAG: hypothetical protein IPI02_24360 [Sterolibacteriaceae bacterium]|nr:hypothetical protein [Sterolibacteriaceae bacterium]